MADMKNVLIIQGGWQGHEPAPVAQRFARMLEKHGYSVTVSDTQEPLADAESLKALDLIVMSWTMGEIDHKYVENISRAVAAVVMYVLQELPCRVHITILSIICLHRLRNSCVTNSWRRTCITE